MRTKMRFDYNGQSVTVNDLMKITGRCKKWVYKNLYTCKSIEDLIKKSKTVRKDTKYTYKGVTGTLKDMVAISGINYDTLKTRLYSGWSVEKAIETPVRDKVCLPKK